MDVFEFGADDGRDLWLATREGGVARVAKADLVAGRGVRNVCAFEGCRIREFVLGADHLFVTTFPAHGEWPAVQGAGNVWAIGRSGEVPAVNVLGGVNALARVATRGGRVFVATSDRGGSAWIDTFAAPSHTSWAAEGRFHDEPGSLEFRNSIAGLACVGERVAWSATTHSPATGRRRGIHVSGGPGTPSRFFDDVRVPGPLVVHGTEVFFVDADVESNGAPSDARLVESIDVATGRRRRLGEGLDLASVSSLRVCGEHVTVAANARGGGTDVLVLDRSESPSTPRRIRSARGTFEALVACDATHAYLAHDDGALEALRLDGIPRSGA